jgi:hypothetical protein
MVKVQKVTELRAFTSLIFLERIVRVKDNGGKVFFMYYLSFPFMFMGFELNFGVHRVRYLSDSNPTVTHK